jgi:hypothetical protein
MVTKRRRFFWAAWWSGAPVHAPFRRPDASDGGASSFEEALAAAEGRAGRPLVVVNGLWARAWNRVLRGEDPWPSEASRRPRERRAGEARREQEGSVWSVLGVERGVTEEELKAAYRRRVLETHPDQGGDAVELRRVLKAYEEAKRRLRGAR